MFLVTDLVHCVLEYNYGSTLNYTMNIENSPVYSASEVLVAELLFFWLYAQKGHHQFLQIIKPSDLHMVVSRPHLRSTN